MQNFPSLRAVGSMIGRARYGHSIKHNPMRRQVNRFTATIENLSQFHRTRHFAGAMEAACS
jgi:hypothetical protein